MEGNAIWEWVWLVLDNKTSLEWWVQFSKGWGVKEWKTSGEEIVASRQNGTKEGRTEGISFLCSISWCFNSDGGLWLKENDLICEVIELWLSECFPGWISELKSDFDMLQISVCWLRYSSFPNNSLQLGHTKGTPKQRKHLKLKRWHDDVGTKCKMISGYCQY